MAMNIAQNISVYSQALDLRVQRQQVLASNIANADTPKYKARDFDFAQAMRNALDGRAGGGLELARTAAAHIAGSGKGGAAELMYRGEYQSAVDGNTVDMDVERAQIADNALQYQVLTQLVSDRFKSLRNALATSTS
jgi:flagellar basal-body rod protein FlgB